MVITPVYYMYLSDCPMVTAGGLQRSLAVLTRLEDISMGGGMPGLITDTTLAALHGCSRLQILQLGDPLRPYSVIPATAVSRSVRPDPDQTQTHNTHNTHNTTHSNQHTHICALRCEMRATHWREGRDLGWEGM